MVGSFGILLLAVLPAQTPEVTLWAAPVKPVVVDPVKKKALEALAESAMRKAFEELVKVPEPEPAPQPQPEPEPAPQPAPIQYWVPSPQYQTVPMYVPQYVFPPSPAVQCSPRG